MKNKKKFHNSRESDLDPTFSSVSDGQFDP